MIKKIGFIVFCLLFLIFDEFLVMRFEIATFNFLNEQNLSTKIGLSPCVDLHNVLVLALHKAHVLVVGHLTACVV